MCYLNDLRQSGAKRGTLKTNNYASINFILLTKEIETKLFSSVKKVLHPRTHCQLNPLHVRKLHSPFQKTDQVQSSPSLVFQLVRTNEYYLHIWVTGLYRTD